MRRALPFLVALLVLAGAAWAGSAQGTLVSRSAVTLDAQGPASGHAGAILAHSLTSLPVFELSAPRATVTLHEYTDVVVNGWHNHVANTSRSWEVTNVTAEVLAVEDARFTSRTMDAPPSMSWMPVAPFELAPVDEADRTDTLKDQFWRFYPHPYVSWSGEDEILVEGDFYVSFSQAEVLLRSDQNATRYDTRTPTDEAAGVELPYVGKTYALVVNMTNGTWRYAGDYPTSVALADVSVEDVRSLRIDDARGAVAGRAIQDDLELLGSFHVQALAQSAHRTPELVLSVDGVIEGYGDAPVALPADARASAWAWALAGATALAALVVVLARRRRRDMDAEQLTQLAGDAAEAGSYGVALDWTRRALAQAPTSARLRMDEAYFLERLGDVEAALESYARAAALGEPQADYQAARLLSSLGGDDDAVVERLRDALARDPTLVLELEEDPPLQRFLRHPGLARELRDAMHGIG